MDTNFTVAVIGLGKLGLPLAVLQAQYRRVLGIDSNVELVKDLNRGISTLRENGVDPLLKAAVRSGNFTAHTTYDVVKDADISLVIVPTPSLADGSFTSAYVTEAVRMIGRAIKDGFRRHVVVICSTVMPGECDTSIRDALEEETDEALGGRLQLIYSPEFIALGSVLHDMQNPDMTIIGYQQNWARDLYEQILPEGARAKPILGMTWVSAEIAKIALNAYVTQKISFANMVSELCDHYPGADAHLVTNALGHDERVGRKYILPGGPFGGPCFPRDNRAFIQTGEHVRIDMPMPRAVDEQNDHQIDRMLKKIQEYGREAVGILGVTYKPGAPVIEESYGMRLLDAIIANTDLQVRVYDTIIRDNPYPNDRRISWFNEPMGCYHNDAVTVLTIPDPDLIKTVPHAFETASRSKAIIIDPWLCIPEGPWHDSHIVTPGRNY